METKTCPVCKHDYLGSWWDHNSKQAKEQDTLHIAFNAAVGAGVAALVSVLVRRIFEKNN